MNLAEKGWIKLHRKVLDCWVWQDKPFDKGRAWIDLLLLAMHRDKKLLIDNEVLVISRGSFMTSIVKLANRWGWSRCKVMRYLDLLESEQMLNTKRTPKGTLVTIVKYEDYQLSDMSDDTPLDTPFDTPNDTALDTADETPNDTADETQKKNIKNIKNEKNIKNNIKPPLSPLQGDKDEPKKKLSLTSIVKDKGFDKQLEEALLDWCKYKSEKRQSYKETGFNKFLTEVQNNVDKFGADEVIRVINLSMANNWQGIAFGKLKETNTQSSNNGYDWSKFKKGGKQ